MSAPVNYRETVIVYLRSETLQDAAKSLGTSYQALASRLTMLRRAGVNVPRKKRSTRLTKLEVAQLNSVINKYLKEEN